MLFDSWDKMYKTIELQDESEKLDFESKLMFLIMRKSDLSFTAFEEVRTFDRFKRKHKTEMKASGQVLEWLGLAKCDDAAPSGWRSTIRLQYALVQQGYRSPISLRMCSLEDEKVFEEIFQGALGKRVSERTEVFVSKQLARFVQSALDGRLIGPFDLVEDVSDLVRPAALDGDEL
jgi:hypothetical protein